MKNDSSRDLLRGDRDDGVSRSPSPRDDPLLGMLDELIRMINHASWAGHDDAPALAEGIVNAIDLKTDLAVRLELRCLLDRRVKDHFAVREPKIHRKCNWSAGSAEHDSPHASRFEVNSTFCRRQYFKNGSGHRMGRTPGRGPVGTKKARRRRQEDAGDCCQRPVP
jgi:hypothetical protein